MPGWMKLKLELRLLKEISATSDMQMAPWQAPVIIFNKFSFNLWHSGVFLGHIEHLLVPHHWVQLPWYIIIVDQHDVLQNSKRISFLQSVSWTWAWALTHSWGNQWMYTMPLLCDDKLLLLLLIVRNQGECNLQTNSCVTSVWYCINKNITSQQLQLGLHPG